MYEKYKPSNRTLFACSPTFSRIIAAQDGLKDIQKQED
jgi:hypothetical protein